MKFMLKLFFLILFIFVSSTIYSQNAIIKGKVMTSENGAAMPFILVSLNNTTHKYTDSKGMFVFENWYGAKSIDFRPGCQLFSIY